MLSLRLEALKATAAAETALYAVLSDEQKKVVKDYGSLGSFGPMVIANRNTFLIDPSGKIVKVWTKVDPSGHSEEVLAALDGFEKK